MLHFLCQAIVRIIAGILGVLALALGLLIWETSVAAIPESISKQVSWLDAFPKRALPIVVFGTVGVGLLLVAIGLDKVQTAAKWVSDHLHAKTPQIEQLQEENTQLRGETKDLKIEQRESEQERKQLKEENEQLRAEDARDKALQAYLDQMERLLLDKDKPLRTSQPDDDVRRLARARTLAVLKMLGPRQKEVCCGS